MLGRHVLTWRRAALRLLGILLFVGAWWWASTSLVGGGGGRLPDPAAVLDRGVALVQTSSLWEATAVTLWRGVAGLVAALVVSAVLALGLARSRVLNAALEPLISMLYPVPRIALYPIAVVALGIGAASQISLVAIECVFPLTVAIYAGLRSINRNMLWATRNVNLGVFRSSALMLRMALPAVVTGLRIAAPLMLILTIAAQMFTGSADGLGYLIMASSARFMTVDIFAIAVFIGILGYLIDQAISLLGAATARHHRAAAL